MKFGLQLGLLFHNITNEINSQLDGKQINVTINQECDLLLEF